MHRPVAFITGAGSGIGRASAILLASEGYRLALVGRRAHRLDETASHFPGGAESISIAADVGHADQARAALDHCLGKWDRLDALINNAGYAPMKPIEEHTPEFIDEVFRINALAPAYLIAMAWPALRQQGLEASKPPSTPRRPGAPAPSPCVINLATQGIDDPYPGFLAYAAAKSAAATMIRSVAREGAAIGVRAFAIAPGAVETEMYRALVPESVVPSSEIMTPRFVAQIILACIRGEHDANNGGVIRLKGR